MNKKETAEFEALKTKLALRFTDEVFPDILPPSNNELRKGFLFNSYSTRVEKACTSCINHSFGNDDKTTTQGSRALYSTELLAWKACRNELEKRFADELRNIDKKIEALINLNTEAK